MENAILSPSTTTTTLLKSALTPSPLSPFDASFTHILSPPSEPLISTFYAADSETLLAHNGQISTYNTPTLFRTSTIRTHFDYISSIRQISSMITAVGSDSSPGLHFYNTLTGKHAGVANWWDPADLRTQKARVTAIDNSGGDDLGVDSLFASFECQHGENAVLVVDMATLKVVSEIGRQSGIAAKSASVRKLRWVAGAGAGVLVGSTITCGAFGYSGYIRVWDPRCGGGRAVWETSEPGGVCRLSRVGDSMADVDVDVEGMYIAKVGSKSGDLGLADLRMLGPDPWVYLEDPNPALRGDGVGGKRVVVSCYKNHVLVGKEGGLEAWSRVEERKVGVTMVEGGEERKWGVYRRNHVDKVEDAERGVIMKIEGGGNRLFVCRENVEGVEVWETSDLSGAKKV